MAIYWPTPDFKGRTFKLCVLTRWDFNFCVRSSPLRGHWAGTARRFSIWETNDRWWRLLEFAKSHPLTLTDSLHPHKLSRAATWHNPDGQVHHHYTFIDLILTAKRFKRSINKANERPFPDADIGSTHDLALTTIKLKLKTKRFTKSPRIRFDLEKQNKHTNRQKKTWK